MGVYEAEIQAQTEHNNEIDRQKKSIEKNNKLRKKYNNMLAKVKAWIPPTPDHVNLKKFMEDQILKSIDWDCDNSYYLTKVPLLSGNEWLSEMKQSILKDIDYYTIENEKEIERINERNIWVKKLRESLK